MLGDKELRSPLKAIRSGSGELPAITCKGTLVHLSYPNASDENVGFALGDGLGRRAPSQFCPAPGCVSCPPSSYLDCWKWRGLCPRGARKRSETVWDGLEQLDRKHRKTLWDRVQNAQNGLGIARNARSRPLRNGLRARS